MTDLYFSGGNFGFVDSHCIHTDTSLTYFSAYFGNQQFTTRNLLFNGCKTAIQIFWDWGWTLQGIAVVSGTTGITVTGGVSRAPLNIVVGTHMVLGGHLTRRRRCGRNAYHRFHILRSRRWYLNIAPDGCPYKCGGPEHCFHRLHHRHPRCTSATNIGVRQHLECQTRIVGHGQPRSRHLKHCIFPKRKYHRSTKQSCKSCRFLNQQFFHP